VRRGPDGPFTEAQLSKTRGATGQPIPLRMGLKPVQLSTSRGTDAVATYLRLTSTSIVYAWMYNNTHGSLLIAMLAHLGHNLAASYRHRPTEAEASDSRRHLSRDGHGSDRWTESRTLRRPKAG